MISQTERRKNYESSKGKQLMEVYDKNVEQLREENESIRRELDVKIGELEVLTTDNTAKELSLKIETITMRMEADITKRDEQIDVLEAALRAREEEIGDLRRQVTSETTVCVCLCLLFVVCPCFLFCPIGFFLVFLFCFCQNKNPKFKRKKKEKKKQKKVNVCVCCVLCVVFLGALHRQSRCN